MAILIQLLIHLNYIISLQVLYVNNRNFPIQQSIYFFIIIIKMVFMV